MSQNPEESRARSSLSQLRKDGAASIDELREFLGDLKGKDPREVMGVIANSGLARSLFVATLGCFLILVVGTAVPYVMGSGKEDDQAATKKKSQSPTSSTVANNKNSSSAVNTKQEDVAKAAQQNKGAAAKRMGITETKKADPNVNPLDNKLKNLLDGSK